MTLFTTLPALVLSALVLAAVNAEAQATRYYLLHPQGQPSFCLAVDTCQSTGDDRFPLVTRQCTGGQEERWTTRLIGDTETITWQPGSDSNACIAANATSDPPQTGQQASTAPCTPTTYNKWQDFARDGNQLVVGSLDQTLWALDRRDGVIPGAVQLWPWVENSSNQVWDFELHTA